MGEVTTFDNEARKTIDEAGDLDDANAAEMVTGISRGIDKELQCF